MAWLWVFTNAAVTVNMIDPSGALGWALLMRQGMAAWTQTLLAQAAEPKLPQAGPGRDGLSIPQRGFILALVALVLGSRWEVAHG